MGLISKILGKDKSEKKLFKGQGYTEEGAKHHAEQRMQAWLREEGKSEYQIITLSTEIEFKKQTGLITNCYITLDYMKKRGK